MDRRLAVRAIILYQGKLLCVRQKPGGDFASLGNSWWCLPGGKVEPREPLVAALEREMLEETAVTPKLGNLLYVHQFMHHEQEALEFFFHVANGEDYAAIDLANTSHGELELAEVGFINPSEHEVLPAFLASEDLAEAIADSHPTAFFAYL
jgi:ADP-ribose pyrophosphatase YjhB (NUDIX family)